MPGVKIVAVLVRCAESLLLCETVDIERLRFSDIENCTERLPALIREVQAAAEVTSRAVVMGRCRWLLEEPGSGLRDAAATVRTPSGTRAPEHQAALGRHE